MRRLLPWILPAAVLAGVTAAMLLPAYLPFQDLPNHDLVLAVTRALRAGQTSEFYQLAERTVFGYSLYYRVDGLLAPWLSPTESLRLQLLLAALALPVSVGMLTRRLGGDAPWGIVLSAPLAVGWSMRMGFASFVIGLPFAFLSAAIALDVCAKKSRRGFLLAVLLVLALMAHQVTGALAFFLVALVWLTHGTPSWRSLLHLGAAALPAALLAASDLRAGGMSAIPGTEQMFGTDFALDGTRRLGTSLPQLVTYAYGIDGPASLPFFLPIAILVGLLVVLAIARPPAIGRRAGVFLVVAAAIPTLAALLLPSWMMGTYLVGERTSLLGVLGLTLAASVTLARAPLVLRAVAFFAAALAVGKVAVDLHHDGAQVAALVGPAPPRSLEGRRWPALLECRPIVDRVWATSEPFRHLWAYAHHPTRGFSPYVFAYRRFVPVWIQRRELPGWLLAEDTLVGRPYDCGAFDARRIARATPGPHPGLQVGDPIVVASPATLAGLPEHLEVIERVGPGLVTVGPRRTRSPPPPR